MGFLEGDREDLVVGCLDGTGVEEDVVGVCEEEELVMIVG